MVGMPYRLRAAPKLIGAGYERANRLGNVRPQDRNFAHGRQERAVERISVSTASSTPQTVTYRGVDDLALVADEWNRDDETAAGRPSILMLHGGGQNRFSWKNTGQVLADGGYHV